MRVVGDDVEVRDLGKHRLKDLSGPQRLYQVGSREFPPLRTLLRSNVPVPATPFVGRESEVDEIASLFKRPDPRVVTLLVPAVWARRGLRYRQLLRSPICSRMGSPGCR